MDQAHKLRSARKSRVSLSLDSQLVEEAKALGCNLSAVAEAAIAAEAKRLRLESWVERNRAAISSWDELLDREGLWSDGTRQF